MMLITFSGCNNGIPEVFDLVKQYKFAETKGNATLKYNDMKILTEFSIFGNSASVKITEPAELSNMRIIKTDGEITLEYMNMRVPFKDMDRLPAAGIICIFDTLINALYGDEHFKVSEKDNEYEIKYDGAFPFTATVKKDGMIKDAKYKSRGIEIAVVFDNISIEKE